ncbi:hypothetical protein [Chelativorans sp. AA-79]|uniref:hypothetical protein n=1 Tax=Chelativorans sp. AA-79 TaxID=3028735 RepID=UPI0023F86764|nr:hypothetical protein [Chelativorans sp. AA-79]WEX07353.1 hypothetical protein PVE73_14600 [Chelativorans sp. AA-79]
MQKPSSRPFDCDALDHLPLFATDKEIAIAIVGRERAAKWAKESLPILSAKPGFPGVDKFHGGRPVPLVRSFYRKYLNLDGHFPGVASGVDRVGQWKGPRKTVLKKREEQDQEANGISRQTKS